MHTVCDTLGAASRQICSNQLKPHVATEHEAAIGSALLGCSKAQAGHVQYPASSYELLYCMTVGQSQGSR